MASKLDLRLGIDVGGTHTDAVVLDRDNAVVAKTKQPTTPDVTTGVRAAIAAVVSHPSVETIRISHVMLGTTHATNAVLERRRLHTVAVLRVGAPSSVAVRPFFGWPDDLVSAIGGHAEIVRGGFEYDGREIVPFDAGATRDFFVSLKGKVDAVAVSAVFSPMSADHELAAADIARDVLGQAVILSLSHEIGSLGLLPRENATILNSALTGVAREVAAALTTSLGEHEIDASVLFAQNDGTLMALDYAVRFPILTIGSGPANSIRGAAFLTGLTDALVADVGGTSTDFGMLVNGFPRESAANVDIGGVSTNFRMPDVLAIALGGGTVVRATEGGVTLGPDSVGFRLPQEALSFGGSTPTLTDAAVHARRAQIGTARVSPDKEAVLEQALVVADGMVAEAVDRMKLGRGDVPMIVVGGGSVLIPDDVPGVSEVLRPEHFDVANAIGAAIAQVSGRWDEVVSLAPGRSAAIESASAQARVRAIQAGADPDHVEIVEIDEIPLAYLTEPVARISVKAVGPLGRL
ncbi:MAG TPA: hydantoinase/oxoprolinase family protein [Nocardioides sp.]|jgi:N-methylhydantoinase A/oxoprolinase/acetone carboxylase beta subunit|uniref:hydantoinase/oxoprolinase family protein n=1 Tax=Nocardioides sp. TaxID=35761 RepID=UPI002E34E0A3|nr:hydantoinase/oxoprolinase family protein [Nocardioides sp.]HEX3930023.1 hydantoinase/oxoprolinase family protein [Nocardioides sp.]